MALLIVVAAILIFRRHRGNEAESQDLPEVEEGSTSALEIPLAPIRAPTGLNAPTDPRTRAPQPVAAAPEPDAVRTPIAFSFEPVGLRLSLVYATLQYRLAITPGADLRAGLLLGDMIGAHASIAQQHQLAPAIDSLAKVKPLPALPAGETVTLTGELQLPLTAIRPLQQGNASFFVPLVRFYIVTDDGDLALRRVFTVGIDGGNAALAPLRLDTGPQEHRQLAAREVEAARGDPMHLDQRRAAG